VGENLAIVDKRPHVTRDCVEEEVLLGDRIFTIIDSAGYSNEKDELLALVNGKIEETIDKVDFILFVVDGRVGVHPLDKEIYRKLKVKNVPFLLVVNKIDEEKDQLNASEFYSLGVKEYVAVSAAHGKNINELNDYILRYFQKVQFLSENKSEAIKISIIGRPNVGKSSLINSIIGEDRLLVTSEPGTTRDIIKISYNYKNQLFLLMDTAGLKKRGVMVKDVIEKASMYKTIKGIENSDVVIYMIDALEGLSSRDRALLNMVLKRGKAVVFAINKWDLVREKKEKKAQLYTNLMESTPYLVKPYVSFVSAKSCTNIYEPLVNAKKVYKIFSSEFKTPLLNEIIQEIQLHYQPSVINGKRVKIYYVTQIGTKPPKFLFFANYPECIQETYKRYIINTLRKSLNLRSVPIDLVFKARRSEVLSRS
jgi:GTP-binding protein